MIAFLILLTGMGESQTNDVVIYGGTSAGITAAIQTARLGKSVVLIEPTSHLGGLTTSGLGFTDSGDKAVVGGLSREFYRRIKKHYDRPEAWKLEKPEQYRLYRPRDDAMWTFEPHVAEATFEAWLKEYKITVVRNQRLDRSKAGVEKKDNRIVSIRMESGDVYTGKVFIDATYEGDLTAVAGVEYTVGREANSQYGELLNGVQTKKNTHNHLFIKNVDPYVVPGDRTSGLLPGIFEGMLPADGESDHRLQAYCYRLCMSNDPRNRLPFPKPAGYNERDHELLLRNFEAGDMRLPLKPDMMPNHKTDTNNNCAVSTDFIGANYQYPEASYTERDAILKRHEVYQKGLMWTLANHPRVPARIREQMAVWGLAKDEFPSTGGWPHQIYVREARRLIGPYVVTELDCRRQRPTPDPIGMGSYNMDSHNCVRYVTAQGFVQNEGDVQESPGGPYQISYRSITPKAEQCTNLLIPVCLSSSHIAYGSIRMEPVFMVLGHSAATAAVLAIDGNLPVQRVSYQALSDKLRSDGQVLAYTRPANAKSIDVKTLKGIVVDDSAATRVGFDSLHQSVGPFVGNGYRHDNADSAKPQEISFRASLPQSGNYRVYLAYSAHPNRAENTLVVISHGNNETTSIRLNQKKRPPKPPFVDLGVFSFPTRSAIVTIKNSDANGYVIADAVQFILEKGK